MLLTEVQLIPNCCSKPHIPWASNYLLECSHTECEQQPEESCVKCIVRRNSQLWQAVQSPGAALISDSGHWEPRGARLHGAGAAEPPGEPA